jgi:monoamine oxidase
MGTNSKLHVEFGDRFWYGAGNNGNTYADTGYQNTWEVSRAQGGGKGNGLLVDYTGGKIGASFGRTKGSYSYWKVGQYTKFSGMEKERVGNCHFCGEHTSQDFQGYLNGAVETGERVVDEILGDLKHA